MTWCQTIGSLAVLLAAACGSRTPAPDQHAARAAPIDAMEEPDDEPEPAGEPVKFHAGVFSQCTGTAEGEAACRSKGENCIYVAMVPHPCSNSGAMCTEEREQTSSPNFPPCVCSCSKKWRTWERSQTPDYGSSPPP